MAEGRGPRKPLDHDPAAVREAREERGLTRTAVAQRLGVSLSLICEIEKGTRNATPATIRELARVLRCSAKSLRRKKCRNCRRPILRCDSIPTHFGCSSAHGWIHAAPELGHSCEPRSNGPYAQPEEPAKDLTGLMAYPAGRAVAL